MGRVVTLRQRVNDEAVAGTGMVVAKQPAAAHAGVEVLERGGNAVDAAVTAAFVTGVVLPLATGIGGGGYLVCYEAVTGTTHVIDYALCAPLAAHERMYDLDPDGGFGTAQGWRRVRGDANWHGWRSMAVPGNVAGLALALERFGTISLAEALAPAIELAEEGFELSDEVLHTIINDWPLISHYPSSMAVLTDRGRPRKVGERLRNPALARTLRRLAEAGASDFYHGQIAREIVADMEDGGGHLTAADLAAYRVRLPEPLACPYRDVTLYGPPGASGAITVFETLRILEGFDLRALDHGSPEALHLWIEASRLAFADRAQYVADPEVIDAPWRGLLAPEYAAERRRQIGQRALARYEAGDPWPFEGRLRPAVQYAPSRPWGAGGTAHVGVVDSQRNVVSLTDTLVGWSGVVLPRTGIVMNNGMTWFDPEPGHAASIAPGKRGVNNMAPVVGLRGGKPWISVGARGGRRIIGTVAQVISNLIDHGMGMQEAISAPNLDCSQPVTSLDARFSQPVQAALEARGHRVVLANSRAGAGAGGILIEPSTGRLHGGENPEGEGVAVGYD